jgi:23S rRNA (guanine2445-N2)-methyltransferase / 23S rRNA (guanine2069-N7)-methyltransferase
MPKFLVTTSKGLENLLEQEMLALGISNIKMSVSSVWFEGDLEQAYKLCYCSRLANRVLLELGSGECSDRDDLYEICSGIDWSMQFDPKRSFSVNFTGFNDNLRNTQFSAQVVKDAIVDFFKEEGFKRPDVAKQSPDIRITGRLIQKMAHLFLDFSGSSLHERGYREDAGRAPLKENLAAGIITRSGWLQNTDKPLCDFFCGSGTLVIEAAQMALKIPAQQTRVRWGFDEWMGHNASLFASVKASAEAEIDYNSKLKLFASDINERELETAQENAQKAGVEQHIQFSKADILSNKIKNFWKKQGITSGHIVINPPYGERLEEITQIANLYLDVGQKLKTEFAGWQLAVITSAVEQLKLFKLYAKKKYKLKNASLDCVLALMEVEEARTDEVRGIIAEEFQNRLRKNFKKCAALAKAADTNAYRVYDADLPNYKVAIDLYADHVVIQEYTAPKNIPENVAEQRLTEVLLTTADVLGVPRSNVHVKTRRRESGCSDAKKNKLVEIQEGPAKFLVNLDDYLDTGLFLDHRLIREKIRLQAKDKRVLNLFSYTCAVSVHAALGDAKKVISVDLSKTFLNWGKENFKNNGINEKYHAFEHGDCVRWLNQNRSNYDLIFIDPPSFSKSKSMSDIFDVQKDHLSLLKDAARRLNPGGTILFSSILRGFTLDQEGVTALGLEINNISQETLPFDFERSKKTRQCWELKK